MQRVMIIGASGSGKTTLARSLGEISRLPVVHIDPMYYTAGWVQRTREETHQMVVDAISHDSWIFEGNFSSSFGERSKRSDTFIFLDFPTYLRLWRVVARTIKSYGRARIGSAEGCPERFDWEFLKFVAGYQNNGRNRAVEAMANAPDDVRIYHLKSRKNVRQFLTDMEAEYEQT